MGRCGGGVHWEERTTTQEGRRSEGGREERDGGAIVVGGRREKKKEVCLLPRVYVCRRQGLKVWSNQQSTSMNF